MLLVDKRSSLAVAGINGFLAVIMGAVAAHAIAHAEAAAMAEKASLYQLIHAAVMAAIAHQQGRFFTLARWMFLAGIILFSGTLYIRALTDCETITKLAPTGGISLMTGWLFLVYAACKSK